MVSGIGKTRFVAALLGGLWLASSTAWAGLAVTPPDGQTTPAQSAEPMDPYLWELDPAPFHEETPASTAGQPPPPSMEDLPRLALIIGASAYQSTVLKNGRSDARLIAKALIELGFDTQIILDPTVEEFRDALSSHERALKRTGGAISVFYYSGQGFQMGSSAYMLAVDAPPENQQDIMDHSIALPDAVAQTAAANIGGASLFMMDTSRDNPFQTLGESRAAPPSDAATKDAEIPIDTAVLYSAEIGGQAFDGEGDNSPFAIAVAGALGQKNLDQAALFRAIRNSVMETSQGKQIPTYTDAMTTPVVLNPSDAAPSPDDDPASRAAVAVYEKQPGQFVPTYEDGSHALLIGVSDYTEVEGRQAWRDLPSVKDDIVRLGAVLKDVHGFEVEIVLDPDSERLESALESFINRHGAKSNARLVIYMAGHGTTTETFGKKTAWFVPADAPAMNPPAPFRNSALNLRRIEEWSETVDAKHVMWVFDSCFSGAAIKMIDTRSADSDDGWSAHLHSNPVRRVLTAGSENEEVPAQSIFTPRLIDVLSGKTGIGENGMITGRQIGDFLREDVIRYNFKQGLKKETPQSDTIVIPGEEGDIIFRIEPQLVAKWDEAKQPVQ